MKLNLHPKCANPDCAEGFRWLGGGRLFRFYPGEEDSNTNDFTAQDTVDPPVEHLWLCEKCCSTFTLSAAAGHEVALQRLHPELPPADPYLELPAL